MAFLMFQKSFAATIKNALNSGCPVSSLPLDQAFFPIHSPANLTAKSVKSMNSMNLHGTSESNGIPFSGKLFTHLKLITPVMSTKM